jgi:hypothetical protein
MLIILLFAVFLAAKLAALALIYQFGPLAAIVVILTCLAIAHRIEPSAGKPRRPPAR